MENEAESARRRRQAGDTGPRNEQKKKSEFLIKIPSYEEVMTTSQSKPTPSLFTPSPSFTQAFDFIKNSEFYTPPKPPSPKPPSPKRPPIPPSSFSNTSAAREIGEVGGQSSSLQASSSSANVVASTSETSAGHPGPTPSRNAILVSHRQKGNPLLKHIRNVRWTFADVICDYLVGQNACALYLSLRYHLLHPDYLYYRIRELQKNFKLRVVLCHVDVEDVVKPLLEVTRTAMLHDCTLLCGWSLEECGRYLETIKVYENKPADIIQGQMDTDYLSRLNHALTAVRHVNKTDVVTLGSTFASLSHIMDASMEDLARCPGIGERKVKRLYDTFHEPFMRLVPNQSSIPETSAQNNPETNSVDERKIEKEAGTASKHQKNEPELSVKSALSVAFAKYSEKVGKKKQKTEGYKNEGKDVSIEVEDSLPNSS